MSVFDALWTSVKSDAKDWLAEFGALQNDEDRVEFVLKLPHVQRLCLERRFSGKDDALAAELVESEAPTLRNCSRAVKLATSGGAEWLSALYIRAKSLMEGQRTQEALRDCELALAANPDHSGLIAIKNKCQAELKAKGPRKKGRTDRQSVVPHRKLTAPPELFKGKNSNIPAASRVVQLRNSSDKGRHLVVSEDVAVGSVLIVEQAVAWSLGRDAVDNHCLHCVVATDAPLPCLQCSRVGFCSTKCREAAWKTYHARECQVLDHVLESQELGCMALVAMRTSLAPENKIVTQQLSHSSHRSAADLLKRTLSAVFLARCLSLSETSPSLCASLLRQLQQCSCNAYQVSELLLPPEGVRGARSLELGGAVYPTVSLTNHSCWPNVARHCYGTVCVVRACRPIRRGEEILDNYGPSFLAEPRDRRRSLLQSQYFFACGCDACVQDWPMSDRLPEARYKCSNCQHELGEELTPSVTCMKCKRQLDNRKTIKRLSKFRCEYKEAIQQLLKYELHSCVRFFSEYMSVLDRLVVHPSLEFIRCHQVLGQCWCLLGNVNSVQHVT